MQSSDSPAVDDLLSLVNDIVPFHMQHNGEAEAIDLLMETQQLKTLQTSTYVDESNFARVCLYLLRSADYVGDVDESKELLETAFEVRDPRGRAPPPPFCVLFYVFRGIAPCWCVGISQLCGCVLLHPTPHPAHNVVNSCSCGKSSSLTRLVSP